MGPGPGFWSLFQEAVAVGKIVDSSRRPFSCPSVVPQLLRAELPATYSALHPVSSQPFPHPGTEPP